MRKIGNLFANDAVALISTGEMQILCKPRPHFSHSVDSQRSTLTHSSLDYPQSQTKKTVRDAR